MGEVEILNYSVLVGHLYLQHGGIDGKIKQILQYHGHVITEETNQKDSVTIFYGKSLLREVGVPACDASGIDGDEQSETNGGTDSGYYGSKKSLWR